MLEDGEAESHARTASWGVCVGGFLSFLDGLEAAFGRWVVAPLESVIFFDVAFWSDDTTIPIVVLWLILAAVFFTVRFQFVNLRAFRHAVDCARGRYSSPDDPGEISHFQALSAALSRTIHVSRQWRVVRIGPMT